MRKAEAEVWRTRGMVHGGELARAASTRAESLVLGAYHHRQYTVLLCWYCGDQHSGIVRLFEVV